MEEFCGEERKRRGEAEEGENGIEADGDDDDDGDYARLTQILMIVDLKIINK